MKTKEEIVKDTISIIEELEFGVINTELRNYLKIKLSTLYDILGEDLPEEYWERVEEAIKE